MSKKQFNTNEFYNQRLYETANFAVIPSLGAIVEGWLLIIPNEQYISFGYLQLPQLFDELHQLMNKIGNVVQKLYGEYVIFENGTFSPDKLVGCGVDYAHMHIVPTKHNLIEIIENDFGIYYDWKQINNLNESVKFIKDNKPYLYYNDQQGNFFITTNDNIPSQLFRKALAHIMEIPEEYDWKKYHFTENIYKTIEAYKDEFQNS